MALTSGISWTHASFNPWRGCTKVSPGCKNCYAEVLAERNPTALGYWGPQGPRVVGAEVYWKLPLKLNADAAGMWGREYGRPRMFCASLADVFEQYDGPLVDPKGRRLYTDASGQWVPVGEGVRTYPASRPLTLDDVRLRVFAQIPLSPNVDWLVLTKRPEQIVPTLKRLALGEVPSMGQQVARGWLNGEPPPNVWLGTSVESQEYDWRIDALAQAPAVCRFLSVEPLLAELDLGKWLDVTVERDRGFGFYRHRPECDGQCDYSCNPMHFPGKADAFNWVIVGGESGNGGRSSARPFDIGWARKIVTQCRVAGVPVWVKQLGSDPVRGMDLNDRPADVSLPSLAVNDDRGLMELRLVAAKGDVPAEWPADLQVQELPHVEE